MLLLVLPRPLPRPGRDDVDGGHHPTLHPNQPGPALVSRILPHRANSAKPPSTLDSKPLTWHHLSRAVILGLFGGLVVSLRDKNASLVLLASWWQRACGRVRQGKCQKHPCDRDARTSTRTTTRTTSPQTAAGAPAARDQRRNLRMETLSDATEYFGQGRRLANETNYSVRGACQVSAPRAVALPVHYRLRPKEVTRSPLRLCRSLSFPGRRRFPHMDCLRRLRRPSVKGGQAVPGPRAGRYIHSFVPSHKWWALGPRQRRL